MDQGGRRRQASSSLHAPGRFDRTWPGSSRFSCFFCKSSLIITTAWASRCRSKSLRGLPRTRIFRPSGVRAATVPEFRFGSGQRRANVPARGLVADCGCPGAPVSDTDWAPRCRWTERKERRVFRRRCRVGEPCAQTAPPEGRAVPPPKRGSRRRLRPGQASGPRSSRTWPRTDVSAGSSHHAAGRPSGFGRGKSRLGGPRWRGGVSGTRQTLIGAGGSQGAPSVQPWRTHLGQVAGSRVGSARM